jgi:dihydrolipoamide dehydrogenase
MHERTVDVAIIGAGTAGMGAYRAASKHTENIVLIDGGPLGTTCARVGCMPSKLLIAAADAAHTVNTADLFGMMVVDKQIDGMAVMRRLKSERDRFVGFVLESVEEFGQDNVIRGYAKFIAPQRLQVDEEMIINAKSIVIATGSSPMVPSFLADMGDRVLFNDDIFEWDDLPESIAVFGTGIIGLELGQALDRLGVRVSIFGRSGRVSPLRDPVCAEYAKKHFSDVLDLTPAATIVDVSDVGNRLQIEFFGDSSSERVEYYDFALAAIGRSPNLTNLAIENAGIDLDSKGIPIFDPYTTQCGDQPVFIAGDVGNLRPLLHEAADEGRIAGKAAADYPEVMAGHRRTPLSIVFTDPQIAILGDRLADLPENGYEIGEISFEDQGRSRVLQKNKGVLRVYGEHGSGRFLGAEMIGPSAEHIGHLLAWARQQDMTVQQMLDMPFYHPVIEEGVRTALRVLNKNLKLGPQPVERCLDCGPGA